MRGYVWKISILFIFCFCLGACGTEAETTGPSTEEYHMQQTEQPDWVEAYREFIRQGQYSFDDWPVSNIYLLDLDRNEVPELILLHDTGGSMGGWYSFYYYDGTEVECISNNEGEPVVLGTGLSLRYYPEGKRLMIYHEMSTVRGNYQGTYGYVRELETSEEALSVRNIIQVREHPELTYEKSTGCRWENEDELVSNEILALAEKYENGRWTVISGEEYIQEKYALLPPEKGYIDYWEYAAEIPLSSYYTYEWADSGDEAAHAGVSPTEEEYAELISRWDQGAQRRLELTEESSSPQEGT